ncbi:MAG TPA: magnesium transporter, partial [Bacteroidales bacterium]|nr:magnesium transporter [Bacteroidales bacterium]
MLNFDVKTLFRHIRKKSWKELQSAMDELDYLQLAEAINRGSGFEVIVLFRFLSRELAKKVFQELSHDKQEDIVKGLAQHASKVADLLNDMEPDDRTAFLGELPGEVAQRLMQLLTPDNREIATRLLGYPEDSIGRLMTPEYVAVKPHFTVEDTLAHIRKYGHDSETLNVIYVVDDNWQLIDDIRIREIILASPEQRISDLIDYKFTSLNAFDDQETAVIAFKMYDRVVLPVLDTAGT